MKELPSPFYPGKPVHPEFFTGRKDQIKEIMRLMHDTIKGSQRNVFIIGERGIGKSSIASFIDWWGQNNYQSFLSCHTFLGNTINVEAMVGKIIEELLEKVNKKPYWDKIKKIFGNTITEAGLFGINIKFNPTDDQMKDLIENFPSKLLEISNKIKENSEDENPCFLIILDDIDKIIDNESFHYWIKSTLDYMSTNKDFINFPLCLILVGLEDKYEALSKYQPSTKRIFNVVKINRMTNMEIEELVSNALDKVNHTVTKEALDLISTYSSGLPVVAHEIGDQAYYISEDSEIDMEDMANAITKAAHQIGTKYIESKITKAIRSEDYKSILKKINKDEISNTFNISHIKKILKDEEKKKLSNFLVRMQELGLINKDFSKKSGSYHYTQSIYPVYLYMISQKK